MENIANLIITKDDDYYVCHKPAGVLTQADKSFATDMVSMLLTKEKLDGIKEPFIAPINRLDRPVEGLVLMARSSKAAAKLTKQLTDGYVTKSYYALVELKRLDDKSRAALKVGENYSLNDYLYKDPKTNTSKVVKEGTREAKEAKLYYRILAISGDIALVDITLLTGRHHQIRVQFANAKMPLVGDTKYNDSYKDLKGWQSLALCSYRLGFALPGSYRDVEYKTTPRQDVFSPFKEYL